MRIGHAGSPRSAFLKLTPRRTPRMSTTTAGRAKTEAPPPVASDLERRTRAIGRELFDEVGRGPSVLERGWWDDRMMALTMSDPRVKVQLFRFIDALPALTSDESVGRHLREYLEQADEFVPWFLKLGVDLAPVGTLGGKALASLARFSATHMAHRFIAGSTPAEAFETVKALRRRGVGFTADLLGEAVISDLEAEAYQQTCIELIRGLAPRLDAMPEEPRLDRSPFGPIPRVNLSLKLTSLTPPVRRPLRRVDDPTGRRTAPADPPGGPREPGVRQRRHGAIRPQGPDLRHLPRRPLRARVPRLGRRRDRRPGVPARGRRGTSTTWRSGPAGGAHRSPSDSSRGPTGTTRSPTPASWAGPCRSTSRSGGATPASSAAPGS